MLFRRVGTSEGRFGYDDGTSRAGYPLGVGRLERPGETFGMFRLCPYKLCLGCGCTH